MTKQIQDSIPIRPKNSKTNTGSAVTQVPVDLEQTEIISALRAELAALKHAAEEKNELLRIAQMQLSQAGKLATLGTVGAGVAHELNNPLTVISAEADEILDAIQAGYHDAQFTAVSAANIKKCAERMRRIIDHIRQYTRKEEDTAWSRLNVNAVIQDALVILESPLLNAGISVELQLAPELPCIWGHPSKLESVFQNLFSNARDAFDPDTKSEHRKLLIQTTANRDEITVTIRDNGCGMPDTVKEKLFEPFFTTKEAGCGTGLGMSIVRSNVVAHNGTITLSSDCTTGTEFTIRLPIERRNSSTIDKAKEGN